MDKFLKGVGVFVLFVLLFIVLATFSAYFVMWLVNYLFTPALLLYIFGTAKLGFWQAWCLSCLTGILFKSTTTTSK